MTKVVKIDSIEIIDRVFLSEGLIITGIDESNKKLRITIPSVRGMSYEYVDTDKPEAL